MAFILLILAGTSVLAQSGYIPGYVVNHSGDTIRGWIYPGGLKENSHQCLFRATKEAGTVTYLPGDIQSFHLDNNLHYISHEITIDSQPATVFLEWAVMGKLNFFLYADQKHGMRYFVQKGNGEMMELVNTRSEAINPEGNRYMKENREYAATLALMLQDCKEILPEVYRSRLDAKDMIRISADYHNRVCPDEQCIIFERKGPKGTVRIGAFGEYDVSWLHQTSLSYISANPEAMALLHQRMNTFSGGAFIELGNFSFVSPKFSARTELSYMAGKYSDATYGVSYALDRFRISEMLKYSFTTGKVRPGVAIGPSFYYRTWAKSYDMTVTFINTNGNEQHYALNFPELERKLRFGLNAQFGLDYSIIEKLDLTLAARYEFLGQFIGYTTDNSYTGTLSIQLGLAYRLK